MWAPGDEHVVFNADWFPVCVVQTTELLIRRFDELDE